MILPGKVFRAGSLLATSALRHHLRHPWQSWLNIIGIMLGVMMVVAVDLANNSARRAFDLSVESVSGVISHQIVGGSTGVPDITFSDLRRSLGLERSAPSISGQVSYQGQSFTLLGVDPISEIQLQRQRNGLEINGAWLAGGTLASMNSQPSILLTNRQADTFALKPGDELTLDTPSGRQQVFLAAVIPESDRNSMGQIILADIAVAQVLLDKTGFIDTIDMVLTANEAEQVKGWLPPGILLVEAENRQQSLVQMTEAFHINLLAMSLLSLLVAGLLIFNTVTLSVLQRFKTLGVLRAQGVSRFQLFAMVLKENALIGLLASLVGTVLGYWLGSILVTLVTRTIDDLYFNLTVTEFMVTPLDLAKGVLLGTALCLVSAAIPAYRASQVAPVTLQQSVSDQGNESRLLPFLTLSGAVLMILGQLLLRQQYGSLVSGFIGLTLIVFGFCLMVPGLMSFLVKFVLLISNRWLSITSRMTFRNLLRSINRTGLAVAALCVALSVTVGVGVMVSSFRQTVVVWLEQSITGDIQIGSEDSITLEQARASQALIGDLAGIERVDIGITGMLESESEPVRFTVFSRSAEDSFYLKNFPANSSSRFMQGEGVLISEPLAYLNRLTPGDSMALLTPTGMQRFPVLGVFYDYTSSSGMIGMHESLYNRWWPGQGETRFAVTLEPGIDPERMVNDINTFLAQEESAWFVVANATIREITLEIFDRTFAITNVLRFLAIIVAFVGVLSTLMALQLERGREYALLRAIGLVPGQLQKLILKQTALLGIFAGLFAIPLGLIMADILIDVINRRSFGWSLQHFLPANVLFDAVLLAIVAALLAGIIPAIKSGKTRPALALREE